MDPVEKAIRNALEKGDAGDAAFRLRVYQAAQSALEKALGAGAVPPQQAQDRKSRLRAIIAGIEAEFTPAVAAPPPPPVAPSRPVPERREPLLGEHAPRAEPSVENFRRHPDFGPAPSVAAPEIAPARGPAADADDIPERPARVSTRLRANTIGRLFVLATVVALAGYGVFWAMDTGLFKSAGERDTSVPNPPANSGEEDFTPKDAGAPQKPGDADAKREWISIFSPRDPTSVQAGNGASAEVIGNGEGQALRIVSSSPEAAVEFDVGEGVLERLAGQKAVFDIMARSLDGKPTQISVTCNLAAFGNCGRKRYEVGYETGEYLFEIDLPDTAPGGGGAIAIVSDVAGSGKALDVVQIRAARAE